MDAKNSPVSSRGFTLYAWTVLGCNLAVILWGAFVRATGSGAGCGEHWPLCNGTAIPHSPQLATVIEFLHRVTSGLVTLLVVALVFFAFRLYPRRHLVRFAAVLTLVFTLLEGALGALIVLLGHVARNTSTARGYTFSAHLLNTLLLLAAITLTAWAASQREIRRLAPTFRGWPAALTAALLAFMLLGVSGAIAALGDTLFASTSLAQGMRDDFLSGAHPFVRLRVWHPFLAMLAGAYIASLCYLIIDRVMNPRATRWAATVAAILVLQTGVGIVNLVLLAPVALQLTHLLLADLFWIALLMLSAEFFFPASASLSPGTPAILSPHPVASTR